MKKDLGFVLLRNKEETDLILGSKFEEMKKEGEVVRMFIDYGRKVFTLLFQKEIETYGMDILLKEVANGVLGYKTSIPITIVPWKDAKIIGNDVEGVLKKVVNAIPKDYTGLGFFDFVIV